jgi:TonB family protein
VKSTACSLLFFFALVTYVLAQESDCTKATVISNGVCVDKNGKLCSKREAQSPICFAPEAQYTEAAETAQIKGKVHLTAMIGTNGCLKDIRVTTPVGYGLDESSVSALKTWRFRKPPKTIANPYRVRFRSEILVAKSYQLSDL